MKTSIVIAVVAILFACSKKHSEGVSFCHNYAPGDVLIGIEPSATMEDVFSMCAHLGLDIASMSGFYHTFGYRQDSITSLSRSLATKPYLNNGRDSLGIEAHYQTRIIHVYTNFSNMDVTNQQDWIATRDLWHLEEMHHENRSILLKVPEGKEKGWIYFMLRNFRIVRWAELNCIGEFQPG